MVKWQEVSVRDGAFKTHVRESGDGPPLLYLHNMAIQNEVWNPVLDQLGQRFRVIAPLHPGFGGSTGGEFIDDPLDIIVYYNDFLDAMGLDKVDVVGHELGGMFAAEIAAVTPHRVNRLVLAAPYGLWVDEQPPPDRFATPYRQLRQALWANPDNEVAATYQVRPRDPSQMEDFSVQEIRALSSGSKFLWQFPDRGLSKRIHRISAPTLLIWGEKDGLIPPVYAQFWEGALQRAQVKMIPDAANLPMLEQPQAFVDAVTEFLGQ